MPAVAPQDAVTRLSVVAPQGEGVVLLPASPPSPARRTGRRRADRLRSAFPAPASAARSAIVMAWRCWFVRCFRCRYVTHPREEEDLRFFSCASRLRPSRIRGGLERNDLA